MTSDGGGLVSVFLPRELGPFPYRIRFRFPNGLLFEREDPYRFQPTLGKLDLHLMSEGKHHQLWKRLGAQYRVMDGVRGTSFAVWAPNAKRVSVVGDFNLWDGRLYPMRALGSSGVWELFIPEVGPGSLYKYELEMQSGELRLKADPLATWP
jgi:1,4-alpha-glucan branching enzyme